MAVDEFGNPIPEESGTPVVTEEPTQTSALTEPTIPQATQGYTDYASELQSMEATEQPSYQNPAEALSNIEVKEGTSYLTPEATVAGQLESLLDKGSPLQQQAQVRAREQASALGMLSSSSAIGAQRRADIEALAPVAMKDAEIAAKFQGAQQAVENQIAQIQSEAEVSGALTQQKAEIAEQQTRINQAFETTIKGLDTEAQAAMINLKGQWDESMKQLEADVTRELQQQEIDANVETMIMNQAHDMLNNYQITIQQLVGNQAFLDSMPNQDAMNQLFDDMFQTVQSSIRFSAKAAGVYDEDMASYVDDLAAANAWK